MTDTAYRTAPRDPIVKGFSAEAARDVLERVERFTEDRVAPRAQEIDETNTFYPDLIEAAVDIGLMRLHLTDDYQIDIGNTVLIHEVTERISAQSAVVATTMGTQRLVAYLLSRWADPALAEQWVPQIVAAKAWGSFGLTEPAAGSDIRGISTVARRDGSDWILNGDKCWIGNAPISNVAVVLAKVDSDSRDAGTIALVVDMTEPGASTGSSPAMSGYRGMPNGTLTFRDVRVPAENALAVEGFRGMMNGLNMARIEAASYACGLLRGSIEASVERASSRKAFGQFIGDMPSIQMKIGRMVTDYKAARELVLRGAESYMQRDGGDQDLISMAKMFASDAARKHTDQAMQIYAAAGIPFETRVSRMNRDSKITQIFDGTSEIHENMLGRRAIRQFTTGGLRPPFVPSTV